MASPVPGVGSPLAAMLALAFANRKRGGALDKATEVLSDPTGIGDLIRYGVTPQEKYRMQQTPGAIPGQPAPYLPTGEENPEATRYASNYLAASQGFLPSVLVKAGNELALDDFSRSRPEADRIKDVGDAGFAAGQKAATPVRRILQLLALPSGLSTQ